VKTRKIILDLCGGTGAWSRPYKEAGYDVRLITLPEYDVRTYIPPNNVYGILAAPPCTMFSIARQGIKKFPRNFAVGMVVVEACLQIIWTCRLKGKLAFWALENPTGYLRQFLGKPPFNFNPCDFGNPWTKKTDLWGWFHEPKKRPVKPNQENFAAIQSVKLYPEYFGKLPREARRSITPPGFARAFFEANR